MKQQRSDYHPATKRDLFSLEERIAELFREGLQLISDQLATKADKTDIVRLENKLDPTIENVNNLKSKWRQRFGTI